MKKFVPVIVVAAVLLLILIAVNRHRGAGVAPGKSSGAAVSTSAADIQKQKKAAAILKEGKAAYDAKNYQLAIQKSQEVLGKVDNMSQEAKNLMQISQIRASGQELTPQTGITGAVKAQVPAPVVSAPVTKK